MKKISTILCVCVLAIAVNATEITTIKQAINLSGKQRMLTQRMLADYVMIGMHSAFRDPKGDLSRVMTEFGTNLQNISAYNKDTAVAKNISKVKGLWEKVQTQIQKEPTLDACKMLYPDLDKLLVYSNDVVVAIKKGSKSHTGEIVDISGRQRMLSQRIAGLYILNMWATDNEMYTKKLDEAMVLFKRSMETLKGYEKNTDEIKALIVKVEKDYTYLEKMRSVSTAMNKMPSLVYKKLDGMLTHMHTVTGLYTAIN